MLCAVVALHVAGLWALQAGVFTRAPDKVAPAPVISAVVYPPHAQQDLPAAKAVEPTKPHSHQPPARAVPVSAATATATAPAAALVAAPGATLAATTAQTVASPATPPGAAASPAPQAAPVPAPSPVTAPAAAIALNVPAMNAAPAAPRVELPSADADYLHNPKPDYPRISRQRGEQGKVVLNVLIGVDGSAQAAEIKTSSGFDRLDQAALATAKAWRYVPGKRGGVVQAMWFSVPITFVME